MSPADPAEATVLQRVDELAVEAQELIRRLAHDDRRDRLGAFAAALRHEVQAAQGELRRAVASPA